MDSKWWGLMQYGVGSGSRSRVAMGRFGWAVLVAWLGVSAAGADADPLSLGKDAAVAATLYGKVEWDGVWNDQPSDTAAAPGGSLLVLPQTRGAKAQPETQLSSAITRLGLNLSGPASGAVALSGKVETDFWGSDQATPAPLLRLRYAWVNLALGHGLSVLAGQADDLVNAVAPPTVDPFVLWFSGHLGFRRPQIRVTQEWALQGRTGVSLALCAAQPNGTGIYSGLPSPTGYNDAGVGSPYPDSQVRVSLSLPSWVRDKDCRLGVAGVLGDARITTDAKDDSLDIQEKGLSGDLQAPMSGNLTVSGQAWAGADLGNYYGNIGQDYVLTPVIASSYALTGWGAWAAFSEQWNPQWVLALGAGVDKITNTGLGAGTPTANGTCFVNLAYYPLHPVKLAAEVHHQESAFAGLGQFRLDGGQLSVAYSF